MFSSTLNAAPRTGINLRPNTGLAQLYNTNVQYQILLTIPIELIMIIALESLNNFNVFIRSCRKLSEYLTPLINVVISKFTSFYTKKISVCPRDNKKEMMRHVQYTQLANNKLHGAYHEFQTFGKIAKCVVNGNYENNKREGEWNYAVDQFVQVVKHFANDKLEDSTYLVSSKYPDVKFYRRSYINDKQHGFEIDYDLSNMAIIGIGCHRRGVLHGAKYTYGIVKIDGINVINYANYTVEYYDNGTLTEQRRYVANKLVVHEIYNSGRLIWGLDHRLSCGTLVSYTRYDMAQNRYMIVVNHTLNGVIIKQVRYVNGLLHYVDVNTANVNGFMVTTKIPYKYGKINGIVITKVGKSKISTVVYRDGKRKGISINYVNNTPLLSQYFDDDILRREERRYVSGRIHEISIYTITIAGKIAQTRNVYSLDAQLKESCVFIDDKVVSLKRWDRDGNLIKSTRASNSDKHQLAA